MSILNRLMIAALLLLMSGAVHAADQLEKLNDKENEAFTLWLRENNYKSRSTLEEAVAAQKKFLEEYRGIEAKSRALYSKYCRDGRQVRKAEEFFLKRSAPRFITVSMRF